jgi:membrane protein YqaA with SNARE-associated domain
MGNDTKNGDGSPKFGRLLAVCVAAAVFCGVLTWVMGTYFPDFPSF